MGHEARANETNEFEARFKALEEKNAQLMAALEAKFEQAAPASSGISQDDFIRGITTAMQSATRGTELLASKLKPEDTSEGFMGPFEHKEGGVKYPKADIAPKREIIWGSRLRLDDLTYAEVLALSTLDKSLVRSERRLARDGKWKATVSDDNQRVLISVPVKTIDDRQDLPAFVQIVQELTTGEKAPELGEMMAELLLLKQEMATLKGVPA